ncbi:sulfate ABC transporter permease subunit CysW [soil metagenome]
MQAENAERLPMPTINDEDSPRSAVVTSHTARIRRAQNDPLIVRWGLTALALATVGLLVIVPVVHVFTQAFGAGVAEYVRSLVSDPDTRHSIFLTLVIAPVAVALNVVFGVMAAWLIARFRFPGRLLLTSLIDLPFSVSPVVAGLFFVLLFGLQGAFGDWLRAHGYQILFAPPALLLVTAFVTIPFVARELIPVLEAIGPEEDLAALSLGATGWQMFWRVTFPNMRWGLIYGVILCNARAMGEFGAIYVVSGHITGQTDTMPLRVEKLFQEYNSPASFAVASLLTMLALVTLAIKVFVERRSHQTVASPVEISRGEP